MMIEVRNEDKDIETKDTIHIQMLKDLKKN